MEDLIIFYQMILIEIIVYVENYLKSKSILLIMKILMNFEYITFNTFVESIGSTVTHDNSSLLHNDLIWLTLDLLRSVATTNPILFINCARWVVLPPGAEHIS